MKKILLAIISLVFCIGASTLVSAELMPSSININEWHIDWSDEFDDGVLNKNNWSYQVGDGSLYGLWQWGNNEKQYYTDRNISFNSGVMSMNAKYEPNVNGTSYNYSSARIYTKDKINVGLGYVEARLRIPSARGIWPAFWMLGTNGVQWPGCGEIDIMESFNMQNVTQSTIHFPAAGNKDVYKYVQKSYSTPTGKTEWHTYGVYRDGEVVSFYLDRILIGGYAVKNATDGDRTVLNDDCYILLNIACGGNLTFGQLPDSNLDVNMDVDYVRYYKAGAPAPTTVQGGDTETTKNVVTSNAKPKKVKIKSAKNIKKRKVKVALKKLSGVSGYQIRWCDNKKFDGYEQKNIKKLKYTIKGLDKKSTCFIKARAYRKKDGKTLYGAWSSVKKVKIKK